jgi:hypothetical protein
VTLWASTFAANRLVLRALSLLGVGLIVLGEGREVGVSRDALLVVAATVATTIYFVLQKPYLRRYPAFDLNAYCIWAGTLLVLPFAGGLGGAVRMASAGTLAAVLCLGHLAGFRLAARGAGGAFIGGRGGDPAGRGPGAMEGAEGGGGAPRKVEVWPLSVPPTSAAPTPTAR